MPFIESIDNVIALPSCSRPTISLEIATRAGPKKPNDAPWATAATSSIQNSTTPVVTATPIPAAAVAMIA